MKSEKTFQKLLLLILILLLAMGISACRSEDLSASEAVSQNSEEPSELLPEQDDAYLIRSTAALEVNENLLLEKVSTSPADYAGVYMDKEGYLVVCVTEGDAVARYEELLNPDVLESYIQQARETLGLEDSPVTIQADDVIRYEIKEYSYAMLSGAQKILSPVMKEYEIAWTAIDQEKNILEVSTVNDDWWPEILAYLQESGYSTDMIQFSHAAKYVEP